VITDEEIVSIDFSILLDSSGLHVNQVHTQSRHQIRARNHFQVRNHCFEFIVT
jgi:hypothetical protein